MIRPLLVLALCSFAACDKPEEPAKTDDAKAEKKDSKAPAKAAKDPKGDSKVPEVHFDIGHDKSGALARAAAVLEAEGVDNEDLRELSHHAEKLPSAAEICKHMAKVHEDAGDQAGCTKAVDHHIVQLGPELFAEAATCLMAAKTVPELDACIAAEEEAEKVLHEKKHGEGLDKATCEKFLDKFEALAIKDAGDDVELVKNVLEEVRADVVLGCVEQGSKAEMECSEKASTLHELRECASHIL